MGEMTLLQQQNGLVPRGHAWKDRCCTLNKEATMSPTQGEDTQIISPKSEAPRSAETNEEPLLQNDGKCRIMGGGSYHQE